VKLCCEVRGDFTIVYGSQCYRLHLKPASLYTSQLDDGFPADDFRFAECKFDKRSL
jgi:hypothetical protein